MLIILYTEMGGSWFWFLLFPLAAHGIDEFRVSAISWNVNSAAKIRDDPQALAELMQCDVIFLQETLHTRAEDCLNLPGYIAQHNLAIPTNRRPSRGSSSFFRIETFVDGSVSQVLLLGYRTLDQGFVTLTYFSSPPYNK